MTPIVEIVEPAMAEILRGKTEAERLAIAWGMWRSARAMLANLLHAEHPDWPEEQVNREIAGRFADGTGWPVHWDEQMRIEQIARAAPVRGR